MQRAAALNSERDKLDKASRTLAGEQVDQPMDMGGADDMSGGDDLGLGSEEGDLGDLGGEEDGGESGMNFNASDVAAGGPSEFGRERR